jgi:hypothetical protein
MRPESTYNPLCGWFSPSAFRKDCLTRASDIQVGLWYGSGTPPRRRMGWIRIDNNKMTWCCYTAIGQSLAHLLVHAIFSTKDRRPFLHCEEIRNEILATRKRFVKFLNVTGSSSMNAMFGIEAPRGSVGRPFRAGRFISFHPGLKRPTSQSLRRGWLFGVTYHNTRGAIASATAAWAILLDRSAVIGKMSKLQTRRGRGRPRHNVGRASPPVIPGLEPG